MSQQKMVQCLKLKQELPGIPFKPLPSEFGQFIFDNISMKAWQMWLQESPRLINTYRPDLQTQEGREFLENQMRLFFELEDGAMAETAWRPPDAG